MDEKLVSVIVPVYNVEKFLRACLDSIIAQTYENLEIILVDDGSTDSSGIICDEYALHDSRIKVIHKENGGLSDARNKGIDISKGEYFVFVDSDDMISVDMIEYLYSYVYLYSVDIAICQFNYIEENDFEIREKNVRKKKISPKIVHNPRQSMYHYFTSKAIHSVAWNKMYNRHLFESVRYPLGKYHEDEFTTYLLIAQSDSIAIGYDKKYLYRVRSNSIVNKNFEKKHLDVIEAAIQRRDWIKIYFPELLFYAEGSIVHATNLCVLKFCRTNNISEDQLSLINEWQTIYRKKEKYFLLFCTNSLKSKLFSIIACINLKFLYKTYRILWTHLLYKSK